MLSHLTRTGPWHPRRPRDGARRARAIVARSLPRGIAMQAPSGDASGIDAFESIALPHLDAVARFARSLTRNREDADDLVQETFLYADRGWDTFDRSADPRPWLFTICRNAFLRMRRPTTTMIESEDGD